MIFFCEDCGGKNTLPSKKMKNGRIIFKCIFCAYPNNYISNSFNTETSNKIKTSFYQAALQVEVIGGFVYHKNKGILVNYMPKILTRADIDFMGTNLLNNLNLCNDLNIDVEQMILYIAKRHTAVKQIDTDCIAVIIAKTQKALDQTSDLFNHLIQESYLV